MKIIYNVNPDVDGKGNQEHGVTIKMSFHEFYELQDLATGLGAGNILQESVQTELEDAWEVIATGHRHMLRLQPDEDERQRESPTTP